MKTKLGPITVLWSWPYAWFRVFGYGLHFKPSKGHEPLFSERYGYRKCFYLGPLRVMVLTP